MRFLAVAFCASLICATSTAPLSGQARSEDPYSITFVRNNLKNAEAFPGGKISFAHKEFERLGDGVSIAMLKVLEEQDLKDPKAVQACLSLIRDSFAYPPIIAISVNRRPKVTMFLLNYLKQNTSDSPTQRDIQETIEYVRHQTAPSEQK